MGYIRGTTSSPRGLLGRREEVDRLERKTLTVFVVELRRVLNPEFKEAAQVDQSHLPLFL